MNWIRLSILAIFLLLNLKVISQLQCVDYWLNSSVPPLPPLLNNTGFGDDAIPGGVGIENTAMGTAALFNNNNGNYNVGFGTQALFENFDGTHNTGAGYKALYNNGCITCSGGNANTAVGSHAMFSNQDGNENTGKGNYSLYSNITSSRNTAIGFQSLYFNINGTENVANGHRALRDNIDGSQNCAIGKDALLANTNGVFNTAIGAFALQNNNVNVSGGVSNYGNYNTAAGHSAMLLNTGGAMNTAVGSFAFAGNLTSNYNSSFGAESFYNHQTGDGNTVAGYKAAYNDQTGRDNVAIGKDALLNGDNIENVAIGAKSLNGNVNNAITLTAAGNGAFQSQYATANVVIIGANADISGTTNLSNALAFGANALVNSSGKLRFGNTNAAMRVETPVAITIWSDGRFKSNVSEEDVKGLEFIMLLRPVVYNFDSKKFTEFLVKDMETERAKKYVQQDFSNSDEIRLSGFIAQEVEEAANKVGYDFDGVNKPKNESDYYTIGYSAFVTPLVKAVQQQQNMIANNAAKTNTLQEKIELQIDRMKNVAVVEKTLSNEEKQNINQNELIFNIYPNPFSKQTTVDFSFMRNFESAEIIMSDMSGKRIFSQPINSKSGTLVINTDDDVQSGIYLCSIVTDGKTISTKKVIIAD